MVTLEFFIDIILPFLLCLVTLCKHNVIRDNTPILNILLTAPQLSIPQKALGTLPEDGSVMPKHVGATIQINKLNESLLYLLVFHAYINEMHGSRSKISSKKSRQAALRGGI
jgi:hypothetical protein